MWGSRTEPSCSSTGAEVVLHAAEQLTKPLDDRKLLLEEVVTLLGRLPANSKLGSDLSNTLIGFLWQDLVRHLSLTDHCRNLADLRVAQPHPPTAYTGASKFRSADGSGNNISDPNLGKAGTREHRIEQNSFSH